MKSGSGSGVGFSGLLTISFIVLKLIGTIDWSWWWVLSPAWVPAVAVVAVVGVAAMTGAFVVLWQSWWKKGG